MVLNERKGKQSKKSCNECAQCGTALIAPVWSEYHKERCIRHLWNCDVCGYEYETTVYLTPQVTAQVTVDAAA